MPKGPPMVTHYRKNYLQNVDINLQMLAWWDTYLPKKPTGIAPKHKTIEILKDVCTIYNNTDICCNII